MLITKDWLKEHSVSGALTREQLGLLGIGWPPPKGWKEQVIGSEIPDQTAVNFEHLAHCRKSAIIAEEERKRAYDAEHAEEIYYTMCDGKGGWTGSWTKPPGFGENIDARFAEPFVPFKTK